MTVDLATREWTTLVASPATPAYPVTIPSIIRCASFDGELVPAFVYARQDMLDKTDASVPVVIYIHGGPESQFVPNFVPANHTLSFQFLLNEMGVAVIAPNVRGSRGYGTRYMKADDQMKREDSVRDIGAILDWIAAHPSLDSKRVCVMGRSYGGYMVLASLVHYSPRLACGVATCGISDFVTFLESTAVSQPSLRSDAISVVQSTATSGSQRCARSCTTSRR
ncbi:Alpha/Beta hydrolase protein [Entophlyctis helioformis]|nr:Alpha/Beta hydrolase protein [Entophlyctis helioformis]